MRTLTVEAVRKLLVDRVDTEGSQVRAAGVLGISQGYLSDLLTGRREFSETICAKLGVTRTITYTKTSK